MTLPRLLALSAIILFGMIGIAAIYKKSNAHSTKQSIVNNPIEIVVEPTIQATPIIASVVPPTTSVPKTSPEPKEIVQPKIKEEKEEKPSKKVAELTPPEADRVNEFFNLTEPKFPIVETITYKSRVDWQKGRPAWLSDYAGHFKTSRHFIARSLNGKPDYLKQDINEGARFNILKPEKKVQFHLIVDTSKCKMWFYYHDLDSNEKVLIKTYNVGLGRIDQSKISGLLTPLGVYSLGSRIVTYKPKIMGLHNGAKTEMIRVFGTRWIPFEKEISNVTAPAKGYGIHGLPWISKNGTLVEDNDSLGKYESDGCIRMTSNDIEEIYAIVITRPTTIEIVKDFFDAENKIQPTSLIENK